MGCCIVQVILCRKHTSCHHPKMFEAGNCCLECAVVLYRQAVQVMCPCVSRVQHAVLHACILVHIREQM